MCVCVCVCLCACVRVPKTISLSNERSLHEIHYRSIGFYTFGVRTILAYISLGNGLKRKKLLKLWLLLVLILIS